MKADLSTGLRKALLLGRVGGIYNGGGGGQDRMTRRHEGVH